MVRLLTRHTALMERFNYDGLFAAVSFPRWFLVTRPPPPPPPFYPGPCKVSVEIWQGANTRSAEYIADYEYFSFIVSQH